MQQQSESVDSPKTSSRMCALSERVCTYLKQLTPYANELSFDVYRIMHYVDWHQTFKERE